MIIYQIVNKLDGMRYIGQTTNSLEQRFREHCYKKSNCQYLSRAIQKYGKENFIIEIIDRATEIKELNDKEEFWISFLDTVKPNGYNLTTGGDRAVFSEETRKKMSESSKGKKKSKEHCENISKGSKGKVFTEEHRRNISESAKKRKHTEESKLKMKISNKGRKPRLGQVVSEETRRKMSKANKGRIVSEETKKKLSDAQKGENNWNLGRKHTEETKRKLSERQKGEKHWNYGKKHSEESKRKMSEARKKYIKEKKQCVQLELF